MANIASKEMRNIWCKESDLVARITKLTGLNSFIATDLPPALGLEFLDLQWGEAASYSIYFEQPTSLDVIESFAEMRAELTARLEKEQLTELLATSATAPRKSNRI